MDYTWPAGIYKLAIKTNGKWRVAGGRVSPWLTRAFKEQNLNQAPGWLAATAYKLSGIPLSRDNDPVIQSPWLRSAADLEELSDIWASKNRKVNRAKRYRRLYAHCPTLAVLRLSDFTTSLSGEARRALLEAAVKKEPWRVYARTDLAEGLYWESHQVFAAQTCLDLLEGDLANYYYLDRAVAYLDNVGFEAEADELIRICLKPGPTSNQLLLAADKVLERAWDERGSGWSSSVTPWGWDNVAWGRAEFDRFVAEGRKHAPQDVRFIEFAIRSERIGEEDFKRSLELFQEGRKIEHCYAPLYNSTLEFMKGKWAGSDAQMLTFAREWKEEDPNLLYRAHSELASHWDDGVEDYFDQPGNWHEAREGFWILIRKNPCGSGVWPSLFTAALWAGKQEEEWKAAEEFLKAQGVSGECHDFALADALDGLVAGKAGSQYVATPAAWARYEALYRSIILSHPDNDLRSNKFAKTCAALSKKESARWAFAHLAQWEEDAWPKADFDKARLWASK